MVHSRQVRQHLSLADILQLSLRVWGWWLQYEHPAQVLPRHPLHHTLTVSSAMFGHQG